MKIKVLLPIIHDILEQEAKDYITEITESGTEIVFDTLDYGTASIESEYDEALACPDIFRKVKEAEEQGFAGVFVDCFGDPGVRGSREITKIPVVGGFEPAMLAAMGLGDYIGIITVLDNVVPLLSGLKAKMGIGDRVKAIDVVNIPVLELFDFKKLIDALTSGAEKAIREKGVHVIVLGCTGMACAAEEVRKNLLAKGYDVPVVDPSRAAVKLLETYAKMNVYPSKRCYMPPTEKERNFE